MTNKTLAEVLVGVLVAVGLALFLAFAPLFLTGCAPRVVTVTEYKERVKHDTIHDARIDSVYNYKYIKEKGDTVWRIDSVFAYRVLYRDRVQVEQVRDSVPYAVEVPVPVRTRNGYDRFTSCGFWIFFVLFLLRVAWWVVKKYYLRV